ncbi:two-component system sensor histidine kinase SaeS [Paenibacillus taihuensis]|uniref:histidine kinase n=1 Tax=Paenibacillus taihuensis TaxID=1156355 RepID=A0A3D9S6U4_9BACL|nr:HAMP domain-containing sensor histidine kinase [Paenibacillus taihuensis]REE88552.1 two-component system sensor histidine kinase SaeS [Paenibacillus taihuensis]
MKQKLHFRSYLMLLNGISILIILVSVFIIYRYMLLSWNEYRIITSITIGAAIISLGVHALLIHPLAKWLRVLSDDTERVAQGDFNIDVPQIGPREFQQLAGQFNRMSSRLRNMFEKLRASEEARSELIANVSHDLRTPMASIQSFVEALQDDVIQDQATFERYLQTIRLETQRLDALIEDLFQLSRLDSGVIELRQQSIAVDSLILEVLQSHFMLLTEKRIEVKVQVPDDIGRIWVDDFEMKRALGNLLQNAIRYSPHSSTIVFEASKRSSNFVELSLKDQGPGIAEQELERVFDRFYRSDPSRGREGGGGAGLGLAIVQSIVRRHGGELGVESRLGEGSRFWLTLPPNRIV